MTITAAKAPPKKTQRIEIGVAGLSFGRTLTADFSENAAVIIKARRMKFPSPYARPRAG